MLPRVLTVAPSTAISWMSYEFFSESSRLLLLSGGRRVILAYLGPLLEVLIRQRGTLPETGQAV